MSDLLPNGDTPWLLRRAIEKLYQLVITNTNNISVLFARVNSATNAASVYTGTAEPNGYQTGKPGDIYTQRLSATATQTWVKADGTGNTGWIG